MDLSLSPSLIVSSPLFDFTLPLHELSLHVTVYNETVYIFIFHSEAASLFLSLDNLKCDHDLLLRSNCLFRVTDWNFFSFSYLPSSHRTRYFSICIRFTFESKYSLCSSLSLKTRRTFLSPREGKTVAPGRKTISQSLERN